MNFKELSQYPVTARVEIGAGFDITVDANKYNGECYRLLGRTYRERAEEFDRGRVEAMAENPEDEKTLALAVARYEQQMELSAITADLEKEQYASVLASDRHGILMDWEQEENDQKVPPTFVNLMQVPGPVLRTIFEAGRDAARPKGQSTPTSTHSNPTTFGTSSDGSSDPTTPSAESLIG